MPLKRDSNEHEPNPDIKKENNMYLHGVVHQEQIQVKDQILQSNTRRKIKVDQIYSETVSASFGGN